MTHTTDTHADTLADAARAAATYPRAIPDTTTLALATHSVTGAVSVTPWDAPAGSVRVRVYGESITVRGRAYIFDTVATYAVGRYGTGQPLAPYVGAAGNDADLEAHYAPASWRVLASDSWPRVSRVESGAWRNDAPDGARRAISGAVGDALAAWHETGADALADADARALAARIAYGDALAALADAERAASAARDAARRADTHAATAHAVGVCVAPATRELIESWRADAERRARRH
jgi:hypothetical protein